MAQFRAKDSYGATDTAEDFGSPSQDRSGRHPGDELRREHGFSVYMRRQDEEPMWTKGGKLFTQSEVDRLIARKGRLKGGLGS